MEVKDLASKLGIKIPSKIDPDQHLMIVESQQDMRLICVHHLNQRHFKNIIQAKDGMEALEKITQLKEDGHTLSAVICSNELEGLTGIDFLDELQARVDLSRPAFLMSVANITKDKLLRCVESGVDDIIGKPFTLADIIPKLQTAFGKYNNPKNPELIYEYAKKLTREEKLDEASKILHVLSKNSPESARPVVGIADIEFKKGFAAQAFQYLEDAEKRNPNFVHTFSLKGHLHSAQGNDEEALTAFKHAIEISPLNPIRYIQAAEILMKLKKYEEMVVILNEARKRELEFTQLHHYLSRAYFFLKDYSKALKYISTALKSEPDNLDYINQQAICYKSQGSVEESLKSYNKIIKLDPANIRALFNKAILLQDTKRIPDAIKTLERLLSKHPDFEKAKKKLAQLKSRSVA